MSTVASHVDISKAKSIGGWMNENELLWLATKAKEFQYVVEFGSLHGRSSRAIADNLSHHGKLWCVDPWGPEYYYEDGNVVPFTTYIYPYFVRNLRDHVDTGRVVPVREFSYQFDLPFHVDMVFIDGDHRYETVVKDIKKAFNLLRSGGLICGHDYGHPHWPGVKEAVDQYVGTVQVEETIWYALKS